MPVAEFSSALVAGPPVRRPVWVASLAGGEPRLLHEDSGGRPRLWLDDNRVLIETFGSGLNSFAVLDVRRGAKLQLCVKTSRYARGDDMFAR